MCFWFSTMQSTCTFQHALAIGQVTHIRDETLCHYWESRWKPVFLTCADSVLLNVIQQPSENLRIQRNQIPRQLFCQPGQFSFLSCQFRVVSATTKLGCAHAAPRVIKLANSHISFFPLFCFLFLSYLKRSCVAFGSYGCNEKLSQALRLRIMFHSGLTMCEK